MSETLTVPVAGGNISVELSGAGPTLLFLHGWTLDREMWRPQQAHFSGDFQVALMDRRGFGVSSAPPSLAAELDDLDAVLGAIGVDAVHLIGMSQGGRVALRYAQKNPDKVRTLTVQGAPLDGYAPPRGAGETLDLGHLSSLAASNRLDELRQHWLSHPMTQCADPQARAAIESIIGRYEARDLRTTQAGASANEPPADLARLTMPVLILTGENDIQSRRLAAARLHENLARSDHHVLPGAGHFLSLSHAAEYNRLLRQFLRSFADG